MKLGNFSYLTLLPNDRDERKLHWQYKIKKIRKTMYFYGLALIVVLLFTVTIFLFGRTIDELVYVFTTFLACCIFSLIYCLSKTSDMFVYLLPIFRLIVHGVYIYATRKLVLDECQCKYSAIFILLLDETYFGMALLFDFVFLSPGVKITLFTYTPIFFCGITCIFLVRF